MSCHGNQKKKSKENMKFCISLESIFKMQQKICLQKKLKMDWKQIIRNKQSLVAMETKKIPLEINQVLYIVGKHF